MSTKSSYETCEICNKQIKQGERIFDIRSAAGSVGEEGIEMDDIDDPTGFSKYLCSQCNEYCQEALQNVAKTVGETAKKQFTIRVNVLAHGDVTVEAENEKEAKGLALDVYTEGELEWNDNIIKVEVL